MTKQGMWTLVLSLGLSSAALAVDNPECPAGSFLTVSGKIKRFTDSASQSFRFSEAELLKLPSKKLKTSVDWSPVAEWAGPTIDDVLKVAGIDSSATKLRAVAHDSFAANIPLTDLATYGPLIAHTKDGKRLTDPKHGPLFVVYPRDQQPELQTAAAGVKFVWALCKIEVQ